MRTAGWSVVVYDSDRRLVAEAWGAVPLEEAPEQLARDGEDYAVKILTDQVSGGNYKLYIDWGVCLWSVRGEVLHVHQIAGTVQINGRGLVYVRGCLWYEDVWC